MTTRSGLSRFMYMNRYRTRRTSQGLGFVEVVTPGREASRAFLLIHSGISGEVTYSGVRETNVSGKIPGVL